MNQAQAFEAFELEVRAECVRAVAGNGHFASPHEAFAVLLEEVEEFKAEVWKKRAQRDRARMFQELVQIAAVCRVAAADLDLCR